MNKIKLGLILMFCLVCVKAHSQEAIVASGGKAEGGQATVNFSVGQVVYTAINGLGGDMSQGVQQAYEYYTATGINEPQFIITTSAYPNPTRDFTVLEIGENENISDLKYELYDSKGRLIASHKIENIRTKIEMGNLAASSYFIRIQKESIPVKIIKIVKY